MHYFTSPDFFIDTQRALPPVTIDAIRFIDLLCIKNDYYIKGKRNKQKGKWYMVAGI